MNQNSLGGFTISLLHFQIGLIDVSNKSERPARVLIPALSGAIYSLSWGEGNNLYACANGDLVMYQVNKPDEGKLF